MELVHEPGLGVAPEAIHKAADHRTDKPGSYLTDAITEDQEFPLDLAAELLVQRGATEFWFGRRWTVDYATSALSEWDHRHLHNLPYCQIVGTYRLIFSLTSQEIEPEPPFFKIPTVTIAGGEGVTELPLTTDLSELAPTSQDTIEDPDYDAIESPEGDGTEDQMDLTTTPEVLETGSVVVIPPSGGYAWEEDDGIKVNFESADPYEIDPVRTQSNGPAAKRQVPDSTLNYLQLIAKICFIFTFSAAACRSCPNICNIPFPLWTSLFFYGGGCKLSVLLHVITQVHICMDT